MRLPRIYQIVEEIDRRFWNEMHAKGVDEAKIYRMAPLNDGYVKMANLAVIGLTASTASPPCTARS